jgi:CTP:molybdopterin cytidylyltransferase MocA
MIYVVLAAGVSRRMGFDKVFTPLGEGDAPLKRIAALLEGRNGIVVVPQAHLRDARSMAPNLSAVVNDSPERGMAHSLRLALDATDAGEDFGVLLGDKPFFTAVLLDRVEGAFAGTDVAYPISKSGVPGHPVLFRARARGLAAQLPDGDTLSRLREAAQLRRVTVQTDEMGAFLDLDEPTHWEAARDRA